MPSMIELIKAKIQNDLDEKIKVVYSVEDELLFEELTAKEELTEEEQESLTALEEKKKVVEKDDEEGDDEEGDDEDDKKEKKDVKMKESLEKILAKVELPEDIQAELTTLFNVAVQDKVSVLKAELAEENVNDLAEAIKTIEEDIDKYVSYVANEWLTENELQVDSGIRLEIAENLLEGMKVLFTENYIEVPEDKVDVVAEAEAAVEQVTKDLDEAVNKNMELQDDINKMKSNKIVNEIASDLTETQKEKFDGLIDSIEFVDESDYTTKVKIVKENYFEKKDEDDNDDNNLDEDEKNKNADVKDDLITNALKFMKKN